MQKKWMILVLAVAACLLFVAACTKPADNTGNTGNTDKIQRVSEGTDTVCEITGYKDHEGEFSSAFLKEGDKVAVIAPSSLPSKKQTDATVEGLKKWGYVPVEGKYVCVEERTLEQCLEDLTWALNDPSIKAVFCVRGGYGASEVMDKLAMDLIRSSKKLLIGYSDITVYHSAWTVCGLPSVQASMSAAFMDLPEKCVEAEQQIIKGKIPSYRCEGTEYDKAGEAEGILIGGNLSTYTSVLMTDFDSTEIGQPYILFLEDVEEDLQHIHRYLTILKHKGVLENAAGIIFGEWTDMPAASDYDGRARGGKFAGAADMICREILDDMDVPVAFGFPAGHGEVNYPLLMGETVKLTVSDGSYTLEWN